MKAIKAFVRQHRLPNTLHVPFPGVSGRDLLAAMSEVAASFLVRPWRAMKP